MFYNIWKSVNMQSSKTTLTLHCHQTTVLGIAQLSTGLGQYFFNPIQYVLQYIRADLRHMYCDSTLKYYDLKINIIRNGNT